ncbi:winged helix-turn-helix transcriptional regulator [Bacillus altitudinis]|uniref:winged helix-turn-helix transcriptional regulator n=1 Tax=Bacillus altitudinis TaxID=293387 RepID=UPI003B51FE23
MAASVLSQTLKHLQPPAILKPHLFPQTPLPIQYSLTHIPHSLPPLFHQIPNSSSQSITLQS